MFFFKPLRLSNFRTHLEMLEEEGRAGEAGAAVHTHGAADGLWCGSVSSSCAFDELAAGGRYVPPDRLAAVYGVVPQSDGDAGAGCASARCEPPRPQWRCDREGIAAELRLRSGLSRAELHRIRRDFALANHPDRVPSSWRKEANQRMTIANALIDHALKEQTA
jgi:hypothetical protein